ncbi:MAG TPA: flagellar protein FlgN [Myxococcota bacterium]
MSDPRSLAERVQALAVVLAAEERLYVELRDLLQHERECMIRLDADALEAAVRRKEALVDEAALLEESRLEVTRAIAAALGLEPRPTLSRLCEALGADAGPLVALHGRLVALLAAVGELVELNASFASEGLEQVRETLASFGRLLPPAPVYGPAGEQGRAPAVARLLQRAV